MIAQLWESQSLMDEMRKELLVSCCLRIFLLMTFRL